jgi:parallel beta-helix repeat protein
VTSSDGIGDAAYVIDASNTDNYPLMQPYHGLVRNLNTGQSYRTIQGAVNNASEGDKILALSGTYYEHVVVNKTVSLIGENKSNTIVDGNETGNVITITANNVNITGFTIQNSEFAWPYAGIYIWFFGGNNVSNNIVTNNYAGILLDSSSNNRIDGNNITNNQYGIYLSGSSGNSIVGNNITANTGFGIYLLGSNNTLRSNSMADNKYNFMVVGGELYYFVNDVDVSNTVDCKPVYYLINQKNLVINSSTYPNVGYLALINSTNITVEGLELKNNGQGILLAHTTNSIITKNTIINNSGGIWLEYSSSNSISGNNITNNGRGILLQHSFSDNNSIVGNNITNNDYGIELAPSSGNKFYHNNFVNNIKQVYLPYSGYVDVWDDGYPSGGNYWSDYAGVDIKGGSNQNETGSDGIGDTPYEIDAMHACNNTDNYPLGKPYAGLYDIGIVNVTTSKTVVGSSYNLTIIAKVLNYGINTENFNVTIYANATTIATFRNIILEGRNSTTITFTWNTTGFAKGNYTIWAYAWPVPGETDTTDNTLPDGWVIIAMVGDITGPDGWPDGKCDMRDIRAVAKLFGVSYPDPRYNPNCDINDDRKIDMRDIRAVAKQFGKTDP